MPEETLWQLKADRAYYVPVYGSGLVAFRTGRDIRRHLRLSAAHTDFPALRIKQRPEIREKGYLKLNAETYGGSSVNRGSTGLFPWPVPSPLKARSLPAQTAPHRP